MANLFSGIKFHNHPTMYINVDYSANRNGGEKDPYVQYSFNIGYTISSGGWFGASNSIGFRITVDGATGTGYLVGNDSNPVSGNISFTAYNTSTSGSSYVEIYMWCHAGTYASPTGTSCNCSAGSGSATYFGLTNSPYYGTLGGYVYYPVYNPYTPSSIWLNPDTNTKIGRVGQSSYSVDYSYNSGSNSNVPISLAIHDYAATSWGVRWEPILRYVNGTSDGVRDSVILPQNLGFTNGSAYRLTLVSKGGETLSPSSWNPQAGVPIYTYQEPVIGTTLTINKLIQSATQSNSFTIYSYNNRAWTNYESPFVTHYRIKRGNDEFSNWTNLGDIGTLNYTDSQMRSWVPKSYDGQLISLEFKRYSPSANWYSTNKAQNSFSIYYRPRIGVTDSNIVLRKNSSSGDVINHGNTVNGDNSFSSIYVSWNYDTTIPEAGYTQGYRIRLYNDQNTIVKTYYTTTKNIIIPEEDIPRLINTYIDVTPYFCNDTNNTADYWYYNSVIEKIGFVRIVSSLITPQIDYPTANSEWLNEYFCVCFQLPEDTDYDYVLEEYKYDNIEIQVNNNFTIRLKDSEGITTQGTTLIAPQCFNVLVDNLTYMRKIIICPALANGFPITNSYNVKVRVQKKYASTIQVPMWSSWSNTRTIRKTVATFIPNVNDIIMAADYNNAIELLSKVTNAYGVAWTIPTDVTRNTIINTNQFTYNNVYKKIIDTKDRVNTYSTFDEGCEWVKFDKQDRISDNFTPISEIITAESNEDNTPNGRNYPKIIYDRCNLLGGSLGGNNITLTNVNKNYFNLNAEIINGPKTTLSRLSTGIKATSVGDDPGTGYTLFGRVPIEDSDELMGKTITLSADIGTSSSTKQSELSIYWMDANNRQLSYITKINESYTTKTYTLPSVYPENATKLGLLFFSSINEPQINGTYVDYSNVKIEIGTERTSWSPYGDNWNSIEGISTQDTTEYSCEDTFIPKDTNTTINNTDNNKLNKLRIMGNTTQDVELGSLNTLDMLKLQNYGKTPGVDVLDITANTIKLNVNVQGTWANYILGPLTFDSTTGNYTVNCKATTDCHFNTAKGNYGLYGVHVYQKGVTNATIRKYEKTISNNTDNYTVKFPVDTDTYDYYLKFFPNTTHIPCDAIYEYENLYLGRTEEYTGYTPYEQITPSCLQPKDLIGIENATINIDSEENGNREITLDLSSNPIRSLPNGIKDELRITTDGTIYKRCNVKHFEYNGSSTISATETLEDRYLFTINITGYEDCYGIFSGYGLKKGITSNSNNYGLIPYSTGSSWNSDHYYTNDNKDKLNVIIDKEILDNYSGSITEKVIQLLTEHPLEVDTERITSEDIIIGHINPIILQGNVTINSNVDVDWKFNIQEQIPNPGNIKGYTNTYIPNNYQFTVNGTSYSFYLPQDLQATPTRADTIFFNSNTGECFIAKNTENMTICSLTDIRTIYEDNYYRENTILVLTNNSKALKSLPSLVLCNRALSVINSNYKNTGWDTEWYKNSVIQWQDVSALGVIGLDRSVVGSTQQSVNDYLASNPLELLYNLHSPEFINIQCYECKGPNL